MKYTQIRKLDTANGKGIGVTIFFSGCKFRCPGCFNHEYWSFDVGEDLTDKTMNDIFSYLENPHVSHLSILGGEPFHQNLIELGEFMSSVKTRFPEKKIWLWTGYKLSDLSAEQSLLAIKYIDYLVDGKFDQTKESSRLLFRGSTNQNIYKKTESGFVKDIELNDFKL